MIRFVSEALCAKVRARVAAISFGIAGMTSSIAVAPIQCSHDPDPNKRMEEEPAQGLYDLAAKFHTEGNEASRIETLRYIVARYPSSRFANMAKIDLEQIAPAPHAP